MLMLRAEPISGSQEPEITNIIRKVSSPPSETGLPLKILFFYLCKQSLFGETPKYYSTTDSALVSKTVESF